MIEPTKCDTCEPTKCDHCGLVGDDRASINDDGREYGFCSRVCLVLFVQQRWLVRL